MEESDKRLEIELRFVVPTDKQALLKTCEECTDSLWLYNNPNFAECLWESFQQSKESILVVADKTTNEVYGFCELNDRGARVPEIGISLKKTARNKGIGTRAMRKAVNKFCEMQQCETLKALVDPGNIRSQKVLYKIGAIQSRFVLFPCFDNESEAEEFARQHPDLADDFVLELVEAYSVDPSEIVTHFVEFMIPCDPDATATECLSCSLPWNHDEEKIITKVERIMLDEMLGKSELERELEA